MSDSQLREAAALTGLDRVVATLPHGWDTAVGHGGVGLSVGQRQRLALTRALLSPAQWIILDEPTAHLDAVSENQIVQIVSQLRNQGRTVVVIAHRQAILEAADQVVEVRSAGASEAEMRQWPQLHVAADTALALSATPRLLEGDLG